MIYEFSQFMNTRYRIPKRNQEWMIQRNRLHLGLLDTGSRKTKLSTKQNTKNSKTAPTKTPGSESKCSRIFYPFPFTKKAGDYKIKKFFL